jgi:methionyl-tRNA formyltransferase
MRLRVVFLGSDAIALPMLEWLTASAAHRVELVAVYTQPDRPVGRGQKVQPNAIKAWALTRGLPVFQPEKLTEATQAELAGLGADLGLVMAYGHILKDAFIATPRLGMINFHASLLPAYRGASPIQTSVVQGELQTGVSLMRIVRELDAGPVADAEAVPVGPRDTALETEGLIAQACVPLLARNLDALAAGTLAFVEQDRSRASFCRKLSKEDGVADFRPDARVVASRINGLQPWPACTVLVDGQPIRLGQAEGLPEVSTHSAQPGQVLGADAGALLIATGRGLLRVLRLQRAGGRMLPAAEFLRGSPIPVGTLLPSASPAPLVSPTPFPRPVKKPVNH